MTTPNELPPQAQQTEQAELPAKEHDTQKPQPQPQPEPSGPDAFSSGRFGSGEFGGFGPGGPGGPGGFSGFGPGGPGGFGQNGFPFDRKEFLLKILPRLIAISRSGNSLGSRFIKLQLKLLAWSLSTSVGTLAAVQEALQMALIQLRQIQDDQANKDNPPKENDGPKQHGKEW